MAHHGLRAAVPHLLSYAEAELRQSQGQGDLCPDRRHQHLLLHRTKGIVFDLQVGKDPAAGTNLPPSGRNHDGYRVGIHGYEPAGSVPGPLQRPAERRVPRSRGDSELAARREGEHGLNYSLPKGRLTQNHGAIVILEGPGHNLGGGGGEAVHQDHDGLPHDPGRDPGVPRLLLHLATGTRDPIASAGQTEPTV